MKISLDKEQAKEFLRLQEMGDNLAIEYYRDRLVARTITVEDTDASRFEKQIVVAAEYLNAAIDAMECGFVKYNGMIDSAYRDIMCELVESARAVCEYEV